MIATKLSMRRPVLYALCGIAVAGCNEMTVDRPAVPDSAVVDGATVRATANRGGDSILVHVDFAAGGTPSTVKLGLCVVTVLAYADTPRVGTQPVWSEEDQPMRDCPLSQRWWELQAGEKKTHTHMVIRREPHQGAPIPRRQLHFAVKLMRASGEEVLVRAR